MTQFKYIQKISFLILVVTLVSCGRNENETSLFKDLATHDNSEDRVTLANKKSLMQLATVIQETRLRTNPLDKENSTKLTPGERVSLVGDTIFIKELNTNFLRVQNQYEEEGWVDENAIIQNIKLGVIIKLTEVFNKPDIFADHKEIMNYGEIVSVTQKQNNGWYSVKRDYEDVEYWTNSLSFISFKNEDVELGDFRLTILANLPNPQSLFQLKAAVDCTEFTSSIFYQELLDTLYSYEPDTLVVE